MCMEIIVHTQPYSLAIVIATVIFLLRDLFFFSVFHAALDGDKYTKAKGCHISAKSTAT